MSTAVTTPFALSASQTAKAEALAIAMFPSALAELEKFVDLSKYVPAVAAERVTPTEGSKVVRGAAVTRLAAMLTNHKAELMAVRAASSSSSTPAPAAAAQADKAPAAAAQAVVAFAWTPVVPTVADEDDKAAHAAEVDEANIVAFLQDGDDEGDFTDDDFDAAVEAAVEAATAELNTQLLTEVTRRMAAEARVVELEALLAAKST